MTKRRAAQILAMSLLFAGGISVAKEIAIPRSVPGDKGKYYLLDKTKTGSIVRALSKRI